MDSLFYFILNSNFFFFFSLENHAIVRKYVIYVLTCDGILNLPLLDRRFALFLTRQTIASVTVVRNL